MTRRAFPLCSAALVALLLAGCGGNASADASRDDAERTTTTSAPATTTTTVPPPYSFDGSVPPPPLINTGTDYEAIYRSLSAYTTWLLAHNPDPTLLADAYIVGTPVYDRFKSDIEAAAKKDFRIVDVDDRLDIEVADVKGSIVSLRVTETLDKEQLVARDGTLLDEADYPTPLRWLATLHSQDQARWRIAAVELANTT